MPACLSFSMYVLSLGTSRCIFRSCVLPLGPPQCLLCPWGSPTACAHFMQQHCLATPLLVTICPGVPPSQVTRCVVLQPQSQDCWLHICPCYKQILLCTNPVLPPQTAQCQAPNHQSQPPDVLPPLHMCLLLDTPLLLLSQLLYRPPGISLPRLLQPAS